MLGYFLQNCVYTTRHRAALSLDGVACTSSIRNGFMVASL
jgi:hypothetical protein